MHNCKATQARLIDLVFEEADPSESGRLRTELKSCAVCRAKYASLSETLGVVDRSFELQKPAETFWPEYHERLGTRVDQFHAFQFASRQSTNPNRRLADLRRVYLGHLRVPVPVAAAFVLLFVLSTLFAVRSRQPVIVAAPTPPQRVETRTVNVPVVQERVVTRVVYVDMNRGRARGTAVMDRVNRDEPIRETGPTGAASSLADFRPTSQVKLTVIKGSFRDEK
ncbi:MAG: hypothetical protein ACREBG_19695 [Pyrinomonadaceae bacterium]